MGRSRPTKAAAPANKRTRWLRKQRRRRRRKRPERRSKPLARARFRPSSSPSASYRKESPMTKLMSKSELIQKVAYQHSLSKKDVKGVIESLASVGYKE